VSASMQSKLRSQEEERGERGNFVIAIDLGASKLRVGVFNNKGVLMNLKIYDTPRNVSSEEFALKISNYIKEVLSELNIKDKIIGIGIATIGPLDLKSGEVVGAPNLNPSRFKLRDPLGKTFKTKVVMANDCVAAVWGEYILGGWRKYPDQAYVTLSTGIGVGVIIEGRLILGRRGNAHELGHGVIDFDSDLICGCGGVGHWEALAGGNNIPKVAQRLAKTWKGPASSSLEEAIKGKLTGPKLFSYARRGDLFSNYVIDFISKATAAGLATVIAAYDPEVIHLGGSVYLNNEDILLPKIKEYLKKYSVFEIPLIRRTTFGSLTPLIGAAALIYETPKNLEVYAYNP
jgi:glucokinase